MRVDDWSDERSSPANTLPPGTPGASWRRVRFRRAVWCAYLLALAVTIYTLGLPTDRIYQATWIVAGLVAFTIDRPWQDHLRVVRDWLPLIAALVVYDLSRGFAHELGMPVRAEELVSVETWLFGGTIPTVWLQENLLSPTGELRGGLCSRESSTPATSSFRGSSRPSSTCTRATCGRGTCGGCCCCRISAWSPTSCFHPFRRGWPPRGT